MAGALGSVTRAASSGNSAWIRATISAAGTSFQRSQVWPKSSGIHSMKRSS